MTARAKVRVEADGGQRLKAALTGARQELERFEKSARQGGRETARDVDRQEKRKTRTRKQELRQQERDARRLHEALDRLEREATREFEQQSRKRSRLAKQESRERRRAAERASPLRTAGRMAAMGAAAFMGGATVAMGQNRQYGGAIGVRSAEEMFGARVQFERELQTLAVKRGYSAEQTSALRDSLNTTAQRTGIEQPELLAGLNQAQSRFADQFDFFAAEMPNLASSAQAAGASLSDVITTVGNIKRANPNMSDEDLSGLVDYAVDIGNRGSVEFGQFAQAFASIPGEFSRGRQAQGVDSVQEMMQVAQLMAAGGTTDSESATMMQRMLQRLNRVDVQRKFRRMTGESITDDEGRLKAVPDIIRTMNAQGLNTPQQMQELLGADIMSSRGIGILQTAMQNPAFLENISGASAEGGREYKDRLFAQLGETGVLQAMTMRAKQFAIDQEDGGLQSEYNRELLDSIETQMTLETRYREVIDQLEVFKGALMAAGGVALASHVLGGGGGIPGGGLAGGARSVYSSAAAMGGGGAMGAAKTFAGAGLAGAAGFGAGTLINEHGAKLFGSDRQVSDHIGEALFNSAGKVEETTDQRGLAAPGTEGTTTEGESGRERARRQLASQVGEEISQRLPFLGDAIGSIIADRIRRGDGGLFS